MLRWGLILSLVLLMACGSVGGPGPGPGPDPDPDPDPGPPPSTEVLMTVAEGRAFASELWRALRPWDVAWRSMVPSLQYAYCLNKNSFLVDAPSFVFRYFPGTLNLDDRAFCDDIVPPENIWEMTAVPNHLPRSERFPMNGVTPAYWVWSDSPSDRGPKLPFGSLTRYPLRYEFLPYRPSEFEVRRVNSAGDVQWLRGKWLETVSLDFNDGGTWVKLPGFAHAKFSVQFVDTPLLELDLRQEWIRNECGESEVTNWFVDDLRVFWRPARSPVDAELAISSGRVHFNQMFPSASGSFALTADDLSITGGALVFMSGEPERGEYCVKERWVPDDAQVYIIVDEGIPYSPMISVKAIWGERWFETVGLESGRLELGDKFVKFSGVVTREDDGWQFWDSVRLEFADGSMSLRSFLVQVGVMEVSNAVRSWFD